MLMNREQIKEVLPHREPFLLVDEVEEMEESGFRAGQAQIIIKMYKNGFTPEQIAAATDKTLEDVKTILSSKDEQ